MKRSVWVLACATIALSACVSPNEVAMKVGQAPKTDKVSTVQLRERETRVFDTLDTKRLLVAATQTLLDLGYTVKDSSSEYGVLVGSKKRDAEESGQVAGQVALTVLFALMGSYYDPTWDKEQTIFATMVTTPIDGEKRSKVRISFDRRLINNKGQLWRSEIITDPKVYKEFFNQLSQGVFLEAHNI